MINLSILGIEIALLWGAIVILAFWCHRLGSKLSILHFTYSRLLENQSNQFVEKLVKEIEDSIAKQNEI